MEWKHEDVIATQKRDRDIICNIYRLTFTIGVICNIYRLTFTIGVYCIFNPSISSVH